MNKDNASFTINSSDNNVLDPIQDKLYPVKNAHPNSITTCHVNVNSVRYTHENIHDLLLKDLVDIMLISETKIDESFPDAQFMCEGFRLHRNDRNESGGGFMCYVRADIPHRRCEDYESNDGVVESLVVELNLKGKKWFIVGIYNPHKRHKAHLISYLGQVLEMTLSEGHETICLGDMNIDMIKDDCIKSNILDVYGFNNLISSPTCSKSNEGTLLDPILVTNKRRFHDVINIPCGYSDFHNFVGCSTKCSVPKVAPRKIT